MSLSSSTCWMKTIRSRLLGRSKKIAASPTGGRDLLVLLETRTLHASLGFGSLHERLPYKSGPQILRHQHGYPRINADHIRVVPVFERVEGIDKAVLGPSRAIAGSN